MDEHVVESNAANIERCVRSLFSREEGDAAAAEAEEDDDDAGYGEGHERVSSRPSDRRRHHHQRPLPLLINNASFYSQVSVLSFLRDVGRHARLNAMLAKDSVATRLPPQSSTSADRFAGSAPDAASATSGLSYAEFSYQLLQANDYYRLYKQENCVLQIGGSDQWGNITAGIELIRRKQAAGATAAGAASPEGSGNIHRLQPEGMTVPLLTTSTGEKFGKSSTSGGTAVWLDASLTRHHSFYQHLLNTSDADVGKYLRLVTTLGLKRIEAVMTEHEQQPQLKKAQIALADAVTGLVRGQEAVQTARRCAAILFAGSAAWSGSAEGQSASGGMHGDDLLALAEGGDLPNLRLGGAEASASSTSLADVLVRSGLVPSKSKTEARRLISAGALSVNGIKLSIAALASGPGQQETTRTAGSASFASATLSRGLLLPVSSPSSSGASVPAGCLMLGVGRDKKAVVIVSSDGRR